MSTPPTTTSTANSLDMNKFNAFLDKATQAISCGPECQQTQTAQELKTHYLKAKANVSLAEPEYQTAKRNYYTFVSGENGYTEMMEKEYTHKANIIAKQFKTGFDKDMSIIHTQLATYRSLLVNVHNVHDLHQKYKQENKELFHQLKQTTNDILTNDRKTFYEDQENESLDQFYFYFLWVVYAVVVLCFIGFSFFFPSQTSWKVRAFLCVVFLALPFFATWLLGKLIWLVYWLISFLPTNVYRSQ